jgi:hypothetical protein
LLCIAVQGCSRGTIITGTVKFSDGEPVTFGNIAFDDGKHAFVGMIKNDGTYTTGLLEDEGIPGGTYKVYLQGTTAVANEVRNKQTDSIVSYDEVYRVAQKFCSRETTDLQIEVKSGGTQTFDITVERP